jgi:lipid-A-disaccharide synthase
VALGGPALLIVAGEASSDHHAADVLHALRAECSDVAAFGVGGPALRAAGLDLVADARELAVVGLAEVLPRVPRILGILRDLTRAARARRPALALLVDSPDFNLRLARRLRRLGIPVLYYVAPQAWAWRRRRVRLLRRVVAKLAVVFPFEESFFGDAGIPTEFVGHPLLDAPVPSRAQARASLGLRDGRVLAVLPGSRQSEVRRHLCPMVAGARRFAGPGGALLLPVASTLDEGFVRSALPPGAPDVRLLRGQSRLALAAADLAVVASGTATVEAALAGTPSVVGYRLSWLTWALARLLVRTPFVAMPNLLAGREIFPELLQGRLTAAAVAEALGKVAGREAEIRDALTVVRTRLGGGGAAARVAKMAREMLQGGVTRA